MNTRAVIILSLIAGGLCGADVGKSKELRYWIEPCTKPETGCEAGDPQLAEWALTAWQSSGQGTLKLERTNSFEKARIRLYWATGAQGRYGEAQPILVEGQPGAAVYVRPDLTQLGPAIASAGRADHLVRDSIVYLTCLHETGHALGLAHTAQFADIMYSFQHGGDIPEYFARYRRKLHSREDIKNNSGISPQDRQRLLAALKE